MSDNKQGEGKGRGGRGERERREGCTSTQVMTNKCLCQEHLPTAQSTPPPSITGVTRTTCKICHAVKSVLKGSILIDILMALKFFL